MRIAICDDEKIYRKQLMTELEKIIKSLDVIIDEYDNGKELIDKYDKYKYELVFLDIEMPAMNGIDLARALRVKSDTLEIVFLTGHIEYALEGYEVNALRYLTKPVNPQKLQEVISFITKKESNKKCIWIKNKDYEEKVLLSDIIYMEAQNQNVEICTRNGTYVHRYNLGDYEKELENEGFCRIHRGYIVALGSIKSIKSREIYVEGDIALPISKSKEKLLKEKLFAYVKEEAI